MREMSIPYRYAPRPKTPRKPLKPDAEMAFGEKCGLAHLHFNDRLIYFMRSSDAADLGQRQNP
jgi:hypothetical protein